MSLAHFFQNLTSTESQNRRGRVGETLLTKKPGTFCPGLSCPILLFAIRPTAMRAYLFGDKPRNQFQRSRALSSPTLTAPEQSRRQKAEQDRRSILAIRC